MSMLKDLKDRKVIDRDLHRKMYLTTDQPPCFYSLLKIHVQYAIVTHSQLHRYILWMWTGFGHSGVPFSRKTTHHVKNLKEFAREVKNLKIGLDKELRSYDVPALITSVPVDKVLIVIKKKLEEHTTLKERSPVTRTNSQVAWLVSEVYILPVPGRILPSNLWRGKGFTSLVYCLQHLLGEV